MGIEQGIYAWAFFKYQKVSLWTHAWCDIPRCCLLLGAFLHHAGELALIAIHGQGRCSLWGKNINGQWLPRLIFPVNSSRNPNTETLGLSLVSKLNSKWFFDRVKNWNQQGNRKLKMVYLSSTFTQFICLIWRKNALLLESYSICWGLIFILRIKF